jgi:hypothetical protein
MPTSDTPQAAPKPSWMSTPMPMTWTGTQNMALGIPVLNNPPPIPALSIPALKNPLPIPAGHRKPAITKQMLDIWFRKYEDNTSGLKKRPNVPHMQSHMFILVFWNKDGKSLAIHCVQNIPDWPLWKLGNDSELMQLLGSDIIAMDVYDIKTQFWMSISLMHIHSLTADSCIFLRHCQVKDCIDLDHLISQLTNKGNHLCQNMHDAWDGICCSLQ